MHDKIKGALMSGMNVKPQITGLEAHLQGWTNRQCA